MQLKDILTYAVLVLHHLRIRKTTISSCNEEPNKPQFNTAHWNMLHVICITGTTCLTALDWNMLHVPSKVPMQHGSLELCSAIVAAVGCLEMPWAPSEIRLSSATFRRRRHQKLEPQVPKLIAVLALLAPAKTTIHSGTEGEHKQQQLEEKAKHPCITHQTSQLDNYLAKKVLT
jgi:hypothetical protein